MPTYDYHCDDCGHEFEIFQGMLEKKLSTCPSCGGRVRRLIGAGAGIVFKGSGFYQTDYRSADYKKRAKSENSTGTEGAASKSEKAEKGGSTSSAKTPAPSKAPKD
jgi:putative FmdB family regulatory protein